MHLSGAASRLQFGGVTLVPDERVVLRDGQPVPMTPKAFDLLLVLAENPGRLLTKEQLMRGRLARYGGRGGQPLVPRLCDSQGAG